MKPISRVTAHSGALRASIKSDEDESILGEGSALTNAMRHLSHYQYHHLHVQRSQTFTFGVGRQVYSGKDSLEPVLLLLCCALLPLSMSSLSSL